MNPLELFTSRKATLRSPLSAQSCAERIAAVTDGMFNLLGTMPLIGTVNERSMSARRRLNYRNSFQTVMSASLDPQGSGTTLHCRFSAMLLVKVFMVVWLIIVTGLGVGLASSGALAPAPGMSPLPFALFPIVFVLIGVLMVMVGRWFARKDESILLEIVREATEATVADRDPGYEPLDRAVMEGTARNIPTVRVISLIAFAVVLVMGLVGGLIYMMGPQP